MSFQPFVVQCQTCGSQLRVADPAIVGTIASCPKCSSMVQIDRPDHQVAVGGSSVDSQAITEEAISSEEGATLGTAAATTSGFAEQSGAASSDIDDAAAGAPMPPQWQSERTQRSRQIGLVVAVSISSLLVAIVGFSWFVQSWRNSKPSTQVTESQAPDSLVDGPPADAETGESSNDPVLDPPVEEAESVGTDVTNSDVTNSDEAATGSETPAIMPEEQSVSPDAFATELPPKTGSIPSDLIPRSPLDPPPPQLPPASPAQPPTSASGMQELPPGLAAYTKFLIDEGSTEQPTLEAPPTMDEVSIDAAADVMDDPTITVRPKVVKLKADLAIRMALDTEGYPLPRLALLVSQISGVPIQIDWLSFDLAGIDLDAPVTTLQGWQSAREILDAVTFTLGAEVREEETLVMITLTDETFDGKLRSLTDLSDFGEGEASAKTVLIDFLRGEGEEASKELTLGSSLEDRQLAAIAADVLRRMRGIEPKVADGPMHRWAWSSDDPTGEWMPLTGGEPGPQQDTPITMSGFLRRMAHRNGASNLINWYDFGSRGVAPERLSIPHTEADAAKTLDRALRPLGLQVRVVDANHWWLGRESTYDRLPAVVWTPPLGENRDRFMDDLSRIMAGASRKAFRITIDPQTDRAIILLPRFIVRQLDKLADVGAAKSE